MIWLAISGWGLLIIVAVASHFAERRLIEKADTQENAAKGLFKVNESLKRQNASMDKKIGVLAEDVRDRDAVIARQESLIAQKDAELAKIGVTRGTDGRLHARV